MKKIVSVILILCLCIAMSSCGGNGGKKWTVGVCQLVQHDALDKATKGFVDTLKAELGDDVEIIEKNASGEASSCTTIANDFVSRNVDLIMANATPALLAVAQATSEIPILGTSVTDYADAFDIERWTGIVGGNVSGTSDYVSLDTYAKMIAEWFPDAQKIGIMFCSSEPNSIVQADEIERVLKSAGKETQRFTFTDSNDVAAVTNVACAWSDVIFIPTDNTAASNAEGIGNIVLETKTPVISGEVGICNGCGVATKSIDYYELGVQTGKMAVEILKNGKDISKMPIEYAEELFNQYNANTCKVLGITPLEGYTPIE